MVLTGFIPSPAILPPPAALLAQADSVIGIIGWSIVLIVFLVGMFVAVSYLKKWMQDDDVAGPVGVGLTLSDLRKIHEAGEMTDEEYERARTKMMASAKAQTANMPDPAGGRRAPGAPPRQQPPPAT
jgi:hypothetical protein